MTTCTGGRISIPEIAARLEIGRLAVYDMLERGIIPGVRLGRRWIITRYADVVSVLRDPELSSGSVLVAPPVRAAVPAT